MADTKTHQNQQHVNPVAQVNIATLQIQSKVQLRSKSAPRDSSAHLRLATMADIPAILVTMEQLKTWSLQINAQLALKSSTVQRKA